MPKRNGARFYRGTRTASDRPRFAEALRDRPKQMELVQAVFDLCNEGEEAYADMLSVEERLNINAPTVLQRGMEGLVSLRLVPSDLKETGHGVWGGTIHTLLLPNIGELSISQPPAVIGSGEPRRIVRL